jgi:hypothetical protein
MKATFWTIVNYLFVLVFMFFSIGMFLYVMRPDGIHGIVGSLVGAVGCGIIAAFNIIELLEDARRVEVAGYV